MFYFSSVFGSDEFQGMTEIMKTILKHINILRVIDKHGGVIFNRSEDNIVKH